MRNITCLTTPTLILKDAAVPGGKRSVILQNQSSEVIYLCFFPTDNTLSTALGFQLGAGQSLTLSPSSPGGPDGSSAITAVSASGTAILHEQHGDYTRTMP